MKKFQNSVGPSINMKSLGPVSASIQRRMCVNMAISSLVSTQLPGFLEKPATAEVHKQLCCLKLGTGVWQNVAVYAEQKAGVVMLVH